MKSPGPISIGNCSPANRILALPWMMTTHSFCSWSYQKSSGEAWLNETIRSIRTDGVSTNVPDSSSRTVSGMLSNKLLTDGDSPATTYQVLPPLCCPIDSGSPDDEFRERPEYDPGGSTTCRLGSTHAVVIRRADCRCRRLTRAPLAS